MLPIAQRLAILMALLGVAVLYGMAAERYELIPYQLVRGVPEASEPEPVSITNIRAAADPSLLPAMSAERWHDEFEEVIGIRTATDVEEFRTRLIRALWGNRELPVHLPHIERDITDARYLDLKMLSCIDKLTVAMDFGLQSIAYQFIPKSLNGHTVIYHEGHGGDFYGGKQYIASLLDLGFAVVAFSMPLLGMNSRPTVDIDRIGSIRLLQHEHMKFLNPTHGHPLRYFVEPVIVAINHIRRQSGNAPVAMVGLSGGGWTTTLAAAINVLS